MTMHEKMLTKVATGSSGFASAAASLNFAGVWKNQYGSKMTLTVSGSKLTGKYESAVSGGGAPITGDLCGFINGDVIAFTVNWPSPAITAWVGQMVNDNGNDVIPTLWQMTMNIADANEPTGMWQSIYAGTDRFHR
jgi:avidin family protein